MDKKNTPSKFVHSLDYFLLNNPKTYHYRIKEQKCLIAENEFMTRYSLHMRFDSHFWNEFEVFFDQLHGNLSWPDIIKIDIPLISLKKMALIKYSAKSLDGKSLPTLRREESLEKITNYFNFMIETLLPTDLSAEVFKFQEVLGAIICANPDKIIARQIEYAEHQQDYRDFIEVIAQLMTIELEKYGIKESDILIVLKNNYQKLMCIFDTIYSIGKNDELCTLLIFPLLLIRDFYKLMQNKPTQTILNLFLDQCQRYLLWIQNVLDIKEIAKKELIVTMLTHYTHFFFIWVSIPYLPGQSDYITKIEFLQRGQQYHIDYPSAALLYPRKKKISHSHLKISQLQYRKILRKYNCLFLRRSIRYVKKIIKVLATARNFMLSALYNCVGKVWFVPISITGGTNCYHYEVTTSDPTLNIEEYGLCDTENKKIHNTEVIFGTDECAKEHLHLYTTQAHFVVDGKRIESLKNWQLWLRVRLDNLRLYFYFSIILVEIYLFSVKYIEIEKWYFGNCAINLSHDFTTVVPLLAVAATLTLLYRASLIAESIIMKWRVCIVAGLLLYITNCFINLIVINLDFIPILNIWSIQLSLLLFLWFLPYQFSINPWPYRRYKALYFIYYIFLIILLLIVFFIVSMKFV